MARAQSLVHTPDGLALEVDSVGRVWIYSTAPERDLTTPQTSFVTVAIDSTVYTNNDRLPNLSHNPWQWKNATVTVDNDTIISVWPISTDVIITQQIYPVLYQGCRVAVLRFFAQNTSAVRSHLVRLQYLLNVETGSAQPLVCSEKTAMNVSNTFYVDSLKYRPFFYSSGIDAARRPANFVQGIWGDPSLQLKKAWRVSVDDWHSLASTLLGPSDVSTGDYADAAVLNEWLPASLPPGTALELGSMAYGPALPFVCGEYPLPIVSFVDHDIRARDSNATTVLESFVCNTSSQDFLSTSVRLLTSGPLTIDKTSPMFSTSAVRDFGGIEPGLFRIVAWKLAVGSSPTDTTIPTTLSFQVRGQSNSDCSDTVTVTPWIRIVRDLDPPIVQATFSGSCDTSQCNAKSYSVTVSDTGNGLASIAATALTNFTLTSDHVTAGDKYGHYRLAVVDSLYDGDASIGVADVAGNVTTEFYHYCTILDRHLPSLSIEHNAPHAIDFVLSDADAWDRGVDSSHVLSNRVNARLIVVGVNRSPMSTVRLRAYAIDPSRQSSICIKAYDLAGNGPVDTCITFGPTAGVDADTGNSVSLSPNPGHNHLTVTPGGVAVSTIAILDLLGNARLTVSPTTNGPITIDLTSLTSGFYIVRVATSNRVISRRIAVDR